VAVAMRQGTKLHIPGDLMFSSEAEEQKMTRTVSESHWALLSIALRAPSLVSRPAEMYSDKVIVPFPLPSPHLALRATFERCPLKRSHKFIIPVRQECGVDVYRDLQKTATFIISRNGSVP
jgi:hypothetical protein